MTDIKQVARRFVNPVSWTRVVVGTVIILAIWQYVTRPTQNIKVGKGGQATFINAPKRFLIPFVEGGVDQHSGSSNLNTYIRAGLRFEF